MNNLANIIVDIIRQCTRQPIGEDALNPQADLRNDLGIDSLGMLMLFERIGSEFNIDPVLLSDNASAIRSYGDLLAQIADGQRSAAAQD